MLGVHGGRALLVVRVLAQPELDVGADGHDGDAGVQRIVQGILDQASGKALPGVVLADSRVVKNPLGPLSPVIRAGSAPCR